MPYLKLIGGNLKEDEEMICPVCDSEISEESEKCPVCGIEIELFRVDKEGNISVDDEVIPDEVVVFECPLCNNNVAEDAKRCPKCGAVFEEDEEKEEEEFNDKIVEARKIFSQVRDTDLGIPYLKTLLKEAASAVKSGNYAEGVRKADECITSSMKVLDVYEIIDYAKQQIIEIKELGGDHTPHLNNLQEVKEMIDAGDYDEAMNSFEKINEEIEEALAEAKVRSAEAVKLAQELESEFENKFEEAKKALFDIREIDIDISTSKALMKGARDAKQEGDIQTAVECLDDLIEMCHYILIVSDLIEEGKDKIKELKERDLEFKSHINTLKKGKTMAEEGEYIESVELLNSALGDMEKTLSMGPKTDGVDKDEVYEDLMDIAMDLLMKVRKTHIAFDDMENLMGKSSELEKDGKVDNAINMLERMIHKSEKLLLIREKIDLGKVKIKELKKYGKADRKYLEALKEGKMMADDGDYDQAIEIIDKTIREMDSVLSETHVEVAVEKEKKPSISDIEVMVSELKALLITAKKHGIKIEGGREIISEALDSVTEKDFENTLALLDKGKDKITDYLKDVIDERMVSLEISMDEIGKDDIKAVERYIRETKKSLENEDYSQALEYLSNANSLKEVSDEPMGEAESHVAYVGKLIFDAEMLGIDSTDANELLDKAKLEIDVGDWESAEEFANDAGDKIFENVPDRLRLMVTEAQTDLKKAKIFGINVSEEIAILKSANMAKDEGDMERCIVLMKRFKEKMGSLDK